MEKVIQFLIKLPGLVMLYGASAIGVLQAITKALKEVLTAIVNSAFPFVSAEKFKSMVQKTRDAINKLDEVLEKAKGYLVK